MRRLMEDMRIGPDGELLGFDGNRADNVPGTPSDLTGPNIMRRLMYFGEQIENNALTGIERMERRFSFTANDLNWRLRKIEPKAGVVKNVFDIYLFPRRDDYHGFIVKVLRIDTGEYPLVDKYPFTVSPSRFLKQYTENNVGFDAFYNTEFLPAFDRVVWLLVDAGKL